MSYTPHIAVDLSAVTLTLTTDNLHWLYAVLTVVVDEETLEETRTATIEASELHIDPLQYWESDGKIYYKIGYVDAVANGQRIPHMLWGNTKQKDYIPLELTTISPVLSTDNVIIKRSGAAYQTTVSAIEDYFNTKYSLLGHTHPYLSDTDSRIAQWNTAYSHSQSAHQAIINGTGFVKASGTTISYDNSTYEPAFSKNTAFNKNFGTTAGTVLEGRTFGTAANSAITDFAPASGSGNYIQNGTSQQSASNWNISGNGIAGGYLQATTAKLTNLTDGYIPYHISDASGLGNSPIYTDGTNVGIGGFNNIYKVYIESNDLYRTAIAINNSYSGSASSRIYLLNSSDTNSSDGFALINNGNNGQVNLLNYKNSDLALWTNSTDRLHITANGRVGVNTDIPQSEFETIGTIRSTYSKTDYNGFSAFMRGIVSNDDAFQLGIGVSGIGTSGEHKLITTGNYYNGTELRFWTSDTRQMTINSSGNVGIGYTTGTEITNNKLAVNGSAYFNTSLRVNNLSGTGTRLTTAASDGTLGSIVNGADGYVLKMVGTAISWQPESGGTETDPVFMAHTAHNITNGTGLLRNNGSGTWTYDNFNVQSLSGTAPTWNASSGMNATITLTGNTTITLSNLVAGTSGNLTVINAASVYTLTISGYTNKISPSVYSSSNILVTSGNSKIDVFSWYYDGTYLIWNGGNNYR